MAPQDRKYAALPDLDEAPDIYETPDLADDTSTLQTSTTARSPSPTPSETSTSAPSGINRHHLQPNLARTQFHTARVDARDADFSDRVSAKRRAYRVSSRRGRGGALVDGNELEQEWGSEDDEEEGLNRRLARLIREAREVQVEIEQRKAQALGQEVDDAQQDRGAARDEDGDEDAEGVAARFRELNLALEKMRVSQLDAGSAHARLTQQLSRPLHEHSDESTAALSNPDVNRTRAHATQPQPQSLDTSAISKVAEFDARLTSLERVLGVSPLDSQELTSDAKSGFNPVIPTLSLLDRQIGLLTSVPSQPHLDAVVQRLQQARTQSDHTVENGDAIAKSGLAPEDMAKLRSLYALLPTLHSLAPTLPLLLARLRSLRTLHTNAAAASHTLDEVERRQDEADKEIKEWAEGLAKVTVAVKDAEGGMRENLGSIDGWVKDLEERVKRLG